MSLPHSFFTRITGGGEFAYLREWTHSTSAIRTQGASRSIRYHVPTDRYVIAWQQTYNSQTAVVMQTINPETGGISGTPVVYYGDIELRSFDLWDNGTAIIGCESGGSGYFLTTNTNRTSVNYTDRIFSGSYGNGYMYPRGLRAMTRPDGNNYFMYTGNYGVGPAFADYNQPSTSSSYANKRWPSDNTPCIPRDLTLQRGSGQSGNDYNIFICGRVDYSGQNGFSGIWSNAFGSNLALHHYDAGTNNYDEFLSITTHGDRDDLSNETNKIYYTCGTGRGQVFPIIKKAHQNGQTYFGRIIRTHDSSNQNGSATNIIYDSFNTNRIYMVGYMVCPVYDTSGRFANGATDGFVMCLNTDATTTGNPTIEWAVGIQETVNGLANVRVDGVECDRLTGQPIIYGSRNSGNAGTGGQFTAKLPSDGSVSGNYGTLSFYNMTPHVELSALTLDPQGIAQTNGTYSHQSFSKYAIQGNNGNTTSFVEI